MQEVSGSIPLCSTISHFGVEMHTYTLNEKTELTDLKIRIAAFLENSSKGDFEHFCGAAKTVQTDIF